MIYGICHEAAQQRYRFTKLIAKSLETRRTLRATEDSPKNDFIILLISDQYNNLKDINGEGPKLSLAQTESGSCLVCANMDQLDSTLV